MEELLKELNHLRKEADTVKANKKVMLETVTESKEYKDLELSGEYWNKAVAELEGEIKSQAVAYYGETREKKPVLGVEVKIFTIVDYDEKAAREWCFTNLRPALKLDKTEFEKIAKTGNVEIATVRQEPRAQIASDLDKVLS